LSCFEILAEQKGIKVKTDIKHNGYINVDAEKLQRAILNLCNNALEILREDNTIEITCEAIDDRLQIKVRDDGPGLPEKIIENIFNPYVTCEKKGGTGLGLSIVKEIINEHQGAVTINPKLEKGAEFIITLPLKPSEAASTR
ncbi:MAG: ATP-binding protein, partial [Oligoflexales bacterium]|nr:ATP-binding protein [Oligoflexales bacterium]